MKSHVRSLVLLFVLGAAPVGLATMPGGGFVRPAESPAACGGCPQAPTARSGRFDFFAAPAIASDNGGEVAARKKATVFASSNFDEDDEGWRFDDGSIKTPSVVPGGGTGRGGGYLEATTEGLGPVWIAPPSFLGDKREATLGALTYFQKSLDNDSPMRVQVTIVPNGTREPIVYTDQITADPDDRGWTQIVVPLDARDHKWKLRDRGTIFPPYSMPCILADIKQIFIAANFDKGQRASLDEVKLTGAKPKPEKPKAEPKKLVFDDTSIVQQKLERVDIRNTGKGIMHLRLLTTSVGAFTVDRSPFELHCSEILMPGDYDSFFVTFKPRDVGRYAEKIFFEIGPPGNTQKVFLKVSGEGYVPKSSPKKR